MATTAVDIVKLNYSAATEMTYLASGTGHDTIDGTDGATLSFPGGDSDYIVLGIDNPTAAGSITIKAGDEKVAPNAALGDLTITLANVNEYLLCIDTSRHMKLDGTVEITRTATSAVRVKAFWLDNGGARRTY